MPATYVAKNVDSATSDATLHTVSEGKILHIASWGGTIKNVSTTNSGHIRLRDGGPAGTIIASWNLPTAVAGTIAPTVRVQAQMPVHKRFSTDLYFEFVSGMVTLCFQVTGFEEDAA